jgi:hypothetical protein
MYRMCRKGSTRHRSDRSGGTEDDEADGVGRAWDEPAPPAARVSDREGRADLMELRRSNGSLVAVFSVRGAAPAAVVRAAKEDYRGHKRTA